MEEAIPSRLDGGAGSGGDTVEEVDVVPAGAARTIAGLSVMGLAVALPVLPALIALGVASATATRVGVGLGALAAVAGGGKLTAAVLGAARVALDSRKEATQAVFD